MILPLINTIKRSVSPLAKDVKPNYQHSLIVSDLDLTQMDIFCSLYFLFRVQYF